MFVCVCVLKGHKSERLCFRGGEHIGPFLTTVTRRQYRVRTEMSSWSRNSPWEAMRPPPMTLACIPVGRHTVVGSDTVPVLARDKMTWSGRGWGKGALVVMQRGPINNCTPLYSPL